MFLFILLPLSVSYFIPFILFSFLLSRQFSIDLFHFPSIHISYYLSVIDLSSVSKRIQYEHMPDQRTSFVQPLPSHPSCRPSLLPPLLHGQRYRVGHCGSWKVDSGSLFLSLPGLRPLSPFPSFPTRHTFPSSV